MDSNYSAVASKDGFVDLQLKDGDFESDVPSRKLVASDQENSAMHHPMERLFRPLWVKQLGSYRRFASL